METDIVIVGGGLSGLALADHLEKAGRNWHLLEAGSTLGGRIRSPMIAGGRFDLGPAWFWPGQPLIATLAERLGLQVFEQFSEGALAYQQPDGAVVAHRGMAPMQGSLRLAGGMIGLVDGLAASLPPERLHLDRPVTHLRREGERVIAVSGTGAISARQVVLALPPRIAADRIRFEPELPAHAMQAARAVPTWMAGQAKILAVYDRPYWREAGFSGDAMSRRGPMVEIHDASVMEGAPYGLFGFVGYPPETRERHRDALLDMAREQLAALFGPAMRKPLDLRMMDWADMVHVATALDRQADGTHPAYGLPEPLRGLWDGQLHFGSTETASGFGGYLEGALEAAQRASRDILSPSTGKGETRPTA